MEKSNSTQKKRDMFKPESQPPSKQVPKPEALNFSSEDKELQEFLSNAFGISKLQLEKEIALTNGFGFVKDTIDLSAGLDPTQLSIEESNEPNSGRKNHGTTVSTQGSSSPPKQVMKKMK